MNEKKHIWDFLSADEQKLSALILCLFALVIVSGVECFNTGDIPGNLKDLIETFVFGVSGINVAGKFSSVIAAKGGEKNDKSNA
ncbi:hypothetical protein [Pectinatus frisingensis]|uniref:hypothetical protein n=1 Tax=Pectinatus frisingensis TaxID=865 RepID=UPI0018C65ECC|nr:hypothetical protein [Pectinatus frisingensis]